VLDAFACGELSGGVLLVNALLAAAQFDGGALGVEFRNLVTHRFGFCVGYLRSHRFSIWS
jgi:hypothetical protein